MIIKHKIFTLFCLLAAFAGCSDLISPEETPSPSEGAPGEVVLKISVPGSSSSPESKAVTGKEESAVNDLLVLLFNSEPGKPHADTLCYISVVDKPTGTDGRFPVYLPVTDASGAPITGSKTARLIVLANTSGKGIQPALFDTLSALRNSPLADQIDPVSNERRGILLSDVIERLATGLSPEEMTGGIAADIATGHRPFTMYGMAKQDITYYGDKAPEPRVAEVNLRRIVARVQVTATPEVTAKFRPESVLLYNYRDSAFVLPNGTNLAAGRDQTTSAFMTEPHIPAGSSALPAVVNGHEDVPTYPFDGSSVKGSIYMFETKQPTAGTTNLHAKRPVLIVKGYYENDTEPCYYRVDFKKGATYYDIIRNYTYGFTLGSVGGRGHDTAQEALANINGNMTAIVKEWAEESFDYGVIHGGVEVGTPKKLTVYQRPNLNYRWSGYNLSPVASTELIQLKADAGLEWTMTFESTFHEGDHLYKDKWFEFLAPAGGDHEQITFDPTNPQRIEGMGTGDIQNVYFAVKPSVIPKDPNINPDDLNITGTNAWWYMTAPIANPGDRKYTTIDHKGIVHLKAEGVSLSIPISIKNVYDNSRGRVTNCFKNDIGKLIGEYDGVNYGDFYIPSDGTWSDYLEFWYYPNGDFESFGNISDFDNFKITFEVTGDPAFKIEEILCDYVQYTGGTDPKYIEHKETDVTKILLEDKKWSQTLYYNGVRKYRKPMIFRFRFKCDGVGGQYTDAGLAVLKVENRHKIAIRHAPPY